MLFRIVCLLTIFGLACGATWRGRLPLKPSELAHKEGCYIKEIGDVIPFGEMVSPLGVCYRIECSRHSISYATCGYISFEEGSNCYITDEDLRRPYPSCCPSVKCEIDNNLI